MGHGRAGALLAVAQCCVENYNAVFGVFLCHGLISLSSLSKRGVRYLPPLSGRTG